MTLSLCRFALAFIWIYQGIVPKWLGPHDDELAMNQVLGASHEQAVWIAYGGGALEVGLGLAILVWWRRRWPRLRRGGGRRGLRGGRAVPCGGWRRHTPSPCRRPGTVRAFLLAPSCFFILLYLICSGLKIIQSRLGDSRKY